MCLFLHGLGAGHSAALDAFAHHEKRARDTHETRPSGVADRKNHLPHRRSVADHVYRAFRLAVVGYALATAHFLKTQAPGCSAYIIGAHGLINALYEVGIPFNDVNPEYVVVGETTGYNYEMIIKATELINKGAKLIGTNGDMTSPSDRGVIPACRALIAPIELATGKKAYFIGKPNPLMMRTGLKKLGVHSEEAVMIGDRMDNDITGGVESGMETVLVMSGVSNRENIQQFSYQPHYILDRVGDLVPKKAKA